jgi:DnaK suppressor protein
LSTSDLDQDFLDNQRRRLVNLKGELERMRDGLAEDQRQLEDQEDDLSEHDSGDMSHSIFDREMDATVEQTAEKRLHYVERALQKLEEGTYGVCDDTGENIPKGRLEAVPEAIRTVEAQQRFELERRPPA